MAGEGASSFVPPPHCPHLTPSRTVETPSYHTACLSAPSCGSWFSELRQFYVVRVELPTCIEKKVLLIYEEDSMYFSPEMRDDDSKQRVRPVKPCADVQIPQGS